MLSKRGAAHFEMIISFIFFMSFVFFLLIILKPYNPTILPNAVADDLYEVLNERASTDLTTFFLKATPPSLPNSCFIFEIPNRFFDGGPPPSIVRDLDGNEYRSEVVEILTARNSNIKIISDKEFYKITLSSEFEGKDVSGSCYELKSNEQEITNIVQRKIISYSSLDKTKDLYNTNYESLKENLQVPTILNFAIISKDLPEINMERQTPSAAPVVAKDYLTEILYGNGTIINTLITIKVW